MVTCAGYTAARRRACRGAVLRARVAELEAQNEVMAAQVAARDTQLEAAQAKLAVLVEQIEELRRRLGKDSSTSSQPPSSDNPHKKSRGTGRCGPGLGASGQAAGHAVLNAQAIRAPR